MGLVLHIPVVVNSTPHRSSCHKTDVVKTWLGCAQFIPEWNITTATCLVQQQFYQVAGKQICACDCLTSDKQAACYYGPTNTAKKVNWELASLDQYVALAAKDLSNRIRKLFSDAGLYKLITSLRTIAALNPALPTERFALYKNNYTPKLVCAGNMLSSTTSNVKPLGLHFNHDP